MNARNTTPTTGIVYLVMVDLIFRLAPASRTSSVPQTTTVPSMWMKFVFDAHLVPSSTQMECANWPIPTVPPSVKSMDSALHVIPGTLSSMEDVRSMRTSLSMTLSVLSLMSNKTAKDAQLDTILNLIENVPLSTLSAPPTTT
jgi:hypothetical protein